MTANRPAVKLLCDEMMARLGRYLRAAGHDTAIGADGANDRALLARAVAEDRMLLTCDRLMLARRGAAGRVMVLPHGVEAAARALSERLDIDWLMAPFTRCLVDNALLRPATPAERRLVPARSRTAEAPVHACPACGRLYWPGSHVKRMADRLARWQRAFGAAPRRRVLGAAPKRRGGVRPPSDGRRGA
jgi:uncharacterized protein with PIN domain